MTSEDLYRSYTCLPEQLLQQPCLVHLRLPEAARRLEEAGRQYLGGAFQWLPEYTKVAEWLTDNHGRGLLCYGSCGRGKSLLCCRLIPHFIYAQHRLLVKAVPARALGPVAGQLRRSRILCVDDIGTEQPYMDYGQRRDVFPELMDEAERAGQLILATTNLSAQQLLERYGERTLDRMRGTMISVRFFGESLRRAWKG